MRPNTSLMFRSLPIRLDGTGVTWIQCASDTFAEMRIGDWPSATEQGHNGRGGGTIVWPGSLRKGQWKSYRFIRAGRFTETTGRPMTSMFSLSPEHTNQTLFVIAQALRDVGAPWAGLASETGARFRHVALSPANGGVAGGRGVVQ